MPYYPIENNCPFWRSYVQTRACEWPDLQPQIYDMRRALAACLAWDPVGSPGGSVWSQAVIPEPLFQRFVRCVGAVEEAMLNASCQPITADGVVARAKAIGLGTHTGKFVCGGVWVELEKAVQELSCKEQPTDNDVLAVQLACDAATDLPLAMSDAWVERTSRVLDWRWPQEARNDSSVLFGLLSLARDKVSDSRVLTSEEVERLRLLSNELETKWKPVKNAALFIGRELLLDCIFPGHGLRIVNVGYDVQNNAFAVVLEGDALPVEPVKTCEMLPRVNAIVRRGVPGQPTVVLEGIEAVSW